MTSMPINVTSTSNNMDTLSRNELIQFVNELLQLNYTKVEQMCTGAAYCQMLHILWRNKIPIKKVKFGAKLEHVYIANWKVLQDSFKKLHIEKEVPIQRLVKGKFQDNFEFLQWFYKFYTINDSGDHDDYDSVAVRGGQGLGPAAPAARNNVKRAPAPKKTVPSAAAVSPIKRSASTAEVKKLEAKVNDLVLTIEGLEKERDFYFSKLRDIEVLCQEKEGDDRFTDFTAAIIEVLYATEEGFGPSDDVEEAAEEAAEEVEQEEY